MGMEKTGQDANAIERAPNTNSRVHVKLRSQNIAVETQFKLTNSIKEIMRNGSSEPQRLSILGHDGIEIYCSIYYLQAYSIVSISNKNS
jgi:hypothetical protein